MPHLPALTALLAAASTAAAQSTFLHSTIQAGGDSTQGYAPVPGYPIIVSGPGPGGANTRAALEYSLAALPPQFALTSLTFRFHTNFPMGLPFRCQAYAYAGDGVIDPQDFLRTSILIGTSPSIEVPATWSIATTDLAALNAALSFGSTRHLGIVMVSTGGTFSAIDDDSLTLNWTPIPTPTSAAALAAVLAFVARRRR